MLGRITRFGAGQGAVWGGQREVHGEKAGEKVQGWVCGKGAEAECGSLLLAAQEQVGCIAKLGRM